MRKYVELLRCIKEGFKRRRVMGNVVSLAEGNTRLWIDSRN